MKKILLCIASITLAFLTNQTNAKVWRINNTVGVTADFATGALALASSSVLNDDTLHFEGSATAYAGFTLNKRLVIIGTGYFLSGINANTGLQANPNSSDFGGQIIAYDSLCSGSTIIGLDNFNFGAWHTNGSATDNITLIRCNLSSVGQYYSYLAGTKTVGWKINKCYIYTFNFSNFKAENFEITNNILTSTFYLDGTSNLNNLVRNNVFRGGIYMYNGYFANNIIQVSAFTVTNVTVKNNLAIGAPTGFTPFVGLNGNTNSHTDVLLFQGLTGNSTDGQWRLKAGSPAIAAGETVLGITPDCGAYGTADPYVLSGIPPIPTIYLLTVPAAIASNATTMPITISTKSNN
ncbi:MAG: hypothetical protein HOO89_10130 [Ferruginibacter sp.]|nr:hypothetical protein [Ferruginibacter sp.]